MKKMVLIIMTVCIIATMGMTSAQADWFTATVTRTGMGGSSAFIALTDQAASPAFTDQWFIMSPSVQNAMLATALTAAANGSAVQVNIDAVGVPPAYSTVMSMYMKAQ